MRKAGNCPIWLRAIRSHAYSFQRTVEVGAAHGDDGCIDAGCCAHPDSSAHATITHAAARAARTRERSRLERLPASTGTSWRWVHGCVRRIGRKDRSVVGHDTIPAVDYSPAVPGSQGAEVGRIATNPWPQRRGRRPLDNSPATRSCARDASSASRGCTARSPLAALNAIRSPRPRPRRCSQHWPSRWPSRWSPCLVRRACARRAT